jgi:hypothetical protein
LPGEQILLFMRIRNFRQPPATYWLGLKIRWCESTVSVRARPPVLVKLLQNSRKLRSEAKLWFIAGAFGGSSLR